MAKVVIFGTGRGADVAHRYMTKDSNHQVCAFTVEKEFRKQSQFKDLPVVDFSELEKHYPPSEYQLFVPLGSQEMNKLRFRKYMACK